MLPDTNTTRLLTYCGRTEESLRRMFEKINESYAEDVNLQALLGESACQSYTRQSYRGFTILNSSQTDPIIDVQVRIFLLFIVILLLVCLQFEKFLRKIRQD